MKLQIDENEKMLYEMSNFSRVSLRQPFDLWVDDAGFTRNTKHSLPRFKAKNNGVEIDIVVDDRNNDYVFIDSDNDTISDFKKSKEAVAFVERFKKPLLMHFYKKIDTTQLGAIFILVIKKKYTIEDAIEFVTSDD